MLPLLSSSPLACFQLPWASTWELCHCRQVAWPPVLPFRSCVVLDTLPDISVVPILICSILGKLLDLCFLPLCCVILGKLPDLSVLPLRSCVILGQFVTSLWFHISAWWLCSLPDNSVLSCLSCVILGKLSKLYVFPLLSSVILVKWSNISVLSYLSLVWSYASCLTSLCLHFWSMWS